MALSSRENLGLDRFDRDAIHISDHRWQGPANCRVFSLGPEITDMERDGENKEGRDEMSRNLVGEHHEAQRLFSSRDMLFRANCPGVIAGME